MPPGVSIISGGGGIKNMPSAKFDSSRRRKQMLKLSRDESDGMHIRGGAWRSVCNVIPDLRYDIPGTK